MRTLCKIKCTHDKPERTAGAERGIDALIATLLLMSLLIAMTLGMTIAVTSDTLIARYYRNFRTSFYAADSGANIARQYMANQILTTIPSTFSNTTQPIPTTAAATVQSNLLTNYGSTATASNLLITSGAAAGSWQGSFYIASSPAPTLTLTSCVPQFNPPTGGGTMNTPTGGVYSCTAGTSFPTCTGTTAQCAGFLIRDYQYVYNYSLTSYGQSIASEQAQVQDAGAINITVNVSPAVGAQTSFAAWGMFINSFPICTDGDLVGGTISGPMFTNGAWTFGESAYTFTDTVGSVSPNFGYDFGATGGSCDQKSSSSDIQGGNTIAPTWQGSPNFKLGQNTVPLPANSVSQKEAVVDMTGANGSITNAQMNASLKTYNGTVYPSAGSTSAGVYLPYSVSTTGTNSVTGAACSSASPCRVMTGGGIYVESNATSVTLTASNPNSGAFSGHTLQVFTIVQGTTTTTVTEDMTANTTTIANQVGSGTVTSLTVNGLPEDDVTGIPTQATMVYVDGSIGTSGGGSTGLSGPGQGVAAIQNNAQVTVTANGDIDVTGDLLYKTAPINIPADTVAVSPTVNSEVLGVFTANGNINLDNQQSNGKIEIDASLAMISATGSGGLYNPGAAINTLTIVGGRIQNTIQSINTTTRNVWFDRRFLQGGFAPPWFPSTTVTPLATDTDAGATVTFTRTSWLAPNE